MAKKLIIETEVKTDGIDKAAQKLGQLKDLGRGLSIQYSIDGKPLDVVIDKSKNLQQQFKLVTAELRKTKEGTAEFQLLAKTQADIGDALGRTKAKAGDLFTSLQLLPGPVGDFASQINGAIALLKTFSSFSLKDLRFQFGETFNDLKDIADNILGTKEKLDDLDNTSKKTAGSTKELNDATKEGTQVQQQNASSLAQNAQAQGVLAASVQKTTTDFNQYFNLVKTNRGLEIDRKKTIIEMTDAEREASKVAAANYVSEVKAGNIKVKSLQATETYTKAKIGEKFALNATTGALEVQTTATIVLTQAERVATFVTNAFKIALVGLGIGAVIILVQAMIESLTEYFSKTKDAEKATNNFNETLKIQAELLKESQAQLDFETKKAELLAQIAGKSEKEIFEIKKKGLEDKKNLLTKELDDAIQLQRDLANQDVTKMTQAQAKARLDMIDTNREKIVKLRDDESRAIEAIELNGLDFQKKISDKKRDAAKSAGDKQVEINKANLQKIVDDTNKANDLLLKLQQENGVAKLDTERKRQDEQLKVDKSNEEKDINNLKISEELKGKLLEQVRVKYAIKVIDINKKRQEEDNKIFDDDQKKLKEYQDKIFDIFNKADTNELSRNKASRAKKFEDDKTALQNDVNFQKQSLEDKIKILIALEKGFNDDIQKLDDDEAQKNRDSNIKKLDDELKFLQIRGEALREGTKSFFQNQRDILKAAEKKELADLADRAIKEKLTIEQIEKEKLAIKQKYLKAGKDIANEELQAILQAAQATLGAAQTIASDIGKVAQLGQQVALEEANLRYIEQNELDKKTITNKLELEKKLLDNQKKFAIEEDAIKKKAFEENKKIQIAQAIIATLQSAVGAYSSLIAVPFVGPVLAPIAAAAALFFGYKQVDLIKKTQYQSSLRLQESQTVPDNLSGANYGENYEKGGMIGGRRHAEGGTLIEAEKGEAIMTRGAVTMFAPLLSMMNQAGGGVSFNSNLTTTRQDNPMVSNPTQEQSPLIVKTYVVSQELTTEANKQARLKNLSTI
jgi:hypothetical protein